MRLQVEKRIKQAVRRVAMDGGARACEKMYNHLDTQIRGGTTAQRSAKQDEDVGFVANGEESWKGSSQKFQGVAADEWSEIPPSRAPAPRAGPAGSVEASTKRKPRRVSFSAHLQSDQHAVDGIMGMRAAADLGPPPDAVPMDAGVGQVSIDSDVPVGSDETNDKGQHSLGGAPENVLAGLGERTGSLLAGANKGGRSGHRASGLLQLARDGESVGSGSSWMSGQLSRAVM